MADLDDLDAAIQQAALGPQQASDDAGSAQNFPLKDLDDHRDRVAARTAAARNHGGIRFFKLEPPTAG
jgi:hypothetical protein